MGGGGVANALGGPVCYSMRFDGYTTTGNNAYSATRAKDALNGDGHQTQTVTLTDVPLSVTSFIITYLNADGRAIATSHISVALKKNQTYIVDVNNIEMAEIALSVIPASAKTPIGVPVYLRAEAKYEDGVSHDVTKDVQ